MRYRKLSPTGDYQFGQGAANFWQDQPEAVAQAALTRLRLQLGEFWLDLTDGTPYQTDVLGAHTQGTRDAALQVRILGTQGLQSIETYTSSVDSARSFKVAVSADTIYGQAVITGVV